MIPAPGQSVYMWIGATEGHQELLERVVST